MPQNAIVKKKRSIWCSKSQDLPVGKSKLKKWDLDVSIHQNIDDIVGRWNDLVPDETFAQGKYLKTLERTNPDNLRNLYVLLSRDESDVAAILIQVLVLNMSESFNYDNYTTDRSYWSRTWQRVRQWFVSLITFRMLTVGNLYLTGQYGIHFADDSYTPEVQFDIVDGLLKYLKKELCNTPFRFNGILYKDFFVDKAPSNVKELGMESFTIDPNMILPLRGSWQSFDDYLLDMRSKYRVRLKNAMRKFKGIERRILNQEEINKHRDRMYDLYTQILDGSGFVLAMGKQPYFAVLKEELKEDLVVTGYFLDDELIGFYTWVMEGSKMDSHFIGFEKSINMKFQLYLNILLDLVRDAIDNKASSLYYYRTALEIKSSVGAEPHDMFCFFKHTNPLINKLVIPLSFKYFVPQQNWKQRHPFKK